MSEYEVRPDFGGWRVEDENGREVACFVKEADARRFARSERVEGAARKLCDQIASHQRACEFHGGGSGLAQQARLSLAESLLGMIRALADHDGKEQDDG